MPLPTHSFNLNEQPLSVQIPAGLAIGTVFTAAVVAAQKAEVFQKIRTAVKNYGVNKVKKATISMLDTLEDESTRLQAINPHLPENHPCLDEVDALIAHQEIIRAQQRHAGVPPLPSVTAQEAIDATSVVLENKINTAQSVWDYIKLGYKMIKESVRVYYEDDPNTKREQTAYDTLTRFCNEQWQAAHVTMNHAVATFPSATFYSIVAALTAVVMHDFYSYYHNILPTYKQLTRDCRKNKSITTRAMALIRTLYRKNSSAYDTLSTAKKAEDFLTTLAHDITVGSVAIRHRNTNAIIDIATVDSLTQALDLANIRYTINQELTEISAARKFLESFDHHLNLNGWYQRGWRYDVRTAQHKAEIIPGTQWYEITASMAKIRDSLMQEKEGIWGIITVPKLGIPCFLYLKNIPYYLQPSRWLCSRGKPFSYRGAKQLWWLLVQQQETLETVDKLIAAWHMIPQNRKKVGLDYPTDC